jgi:hypothetical protein
MSPRPDPLNLLLAGLLAAIAILLALRPGPAILHVIALPFAFLAGHFHARYRHQRICALRCGR